MYSPFEKYRTDLLAAIVYIYINVARERVEKNIEKLMNEFNKQQTYKTLRDPWNGNTETKWSQSKNVASYLCNSSFSLDSLLSIEHPAWEGSLLNKFLIGGLFLHRDLLFWIFYDQNLNFILKFLAIFNKII